MTLQEQIQAMAAEVLAPEYFVLEVQIVQSNKKQKVLILLDGDQGVGIDVCAEVSRHVGQQLEEQEVMAQAYILEVSSPGAESPLKIPRQYPQHIGRSLALELDQAQSLQGKLLEVLPEGIVIEKEIKLKGKKAEKERLNIAFADIKKATVQISFK
jgi:ribosome maturation factor RimP